MSYYGRMNTGRPVFAQLMSLIHPEVFHRCVTRFNGQERLRSFSCWDQFLCMAFGQLTFRDSLRETVDCLCARSDCLGEEKETEDKTHPNNYFGLAAHLPTPTEFWSCTSFRKVLP